MSRRTTGRRDTTTRSVLARIDSTMRSSGTLVTRTPRRRATRNGKRIDVKSPSATSTSAPEGNDAATAPANDETFAPMATSPALTSTIRANAARERSTKTS